LVEDSTWNSNGEENHSVYPRKIFKHTLDEETLGGDPYESEERREETRN